MELLLYLHRCDEKDGDGKLDSLFKIPDSKLLDKKTKKSIITKFKNVELTIEEVQELSGITYPPYYVEPVLTITESTDNVGGIGVLYARTIPVEVNGVVQIVVELTAPLVMFASRKALKLILAHELLHYVELVRNFTKLDVVSQITSSSVYEERHTDSSRAVDPSKIFSNKVLVRELNKRASAGFDDEKLAEKCRTKWIEKGLPVAKIPLGQNQVNVSIEAIMKSNFDPRVKEIVTTIL